VPCFHAGRESKPKKARLQACKPLLIRTFRSFEFCSFVLVSDFEFRISNLVTPWVVEEANVRIQRTLSWAVPCPMHFPGMTTLKIRGDLSIRLMHGPRHGGRGHLTRMSTIKWAKDEFGICRTGWSIPLPTNVIPSERSTLCRVRYGSAWHSAFLFLPHLTFGYFSIQYSTSISVNPCPGAVNPWYGPDAPSNSSMRDSGR